MTAGRAAKAARGEAAARGETAARRRVEVGSKSDAAIGHCRDASTTWSGLRAEHVAGPFRQTAITTSLFLPPSTRLLAAASPPRRLASSPLSRLSPPPPSLPLPPLTAAAAAVAADNDDDNIPATAIVVAGTALNVVVKMRTAVMTSARNRLNQRALMTRRKRKIAPQQRAPRLTRNTRSPSVLPHPRALSSCRRFCAALRLWDSMLGLCARLLCRAPNLCIIFTPHRKVSRRSLLSPPPPFRDRRHPSFVLHASEQMKLTAFAHHSAINDALADSSHMDWRTQADNALVTRVHLRHVAAGKTNSTRDLHLLRGSAASECDRRYASDACMLEAINHPVVMPGLLSTGRAASSNAWVIGHVPCMVLSSSGWYRVVNSDEGEETEGTNMLIRARAVQSGIKWYKCVKSGVIWYIHQSGLFLIAAAVKYCSGWSEESKSVVFKPAYTTAKVKGYGEQRARKNVVEKGTTRRYERNLARNRSTKSEKLRVRARLDGAPEGHPSSSSGKGLGVYSLFRLAFPPKLLNAIRVGERVQDALSGCIELVPRGGCACGIIEVGGLRDK
ncbi:hypothetical protein GGG16DRAFT_106374 [Schizophyllum commune]